MRLRLCLALFCLLAGAAQAAELQVSLKTAKGQPVRDAVVTLYPASGGGGPSRLEGPFRMAQDHLMFDPFVLIVPQGGTVSFPNHDTVRHQVYSFSPTHPFELKLYGHDESRSVRFDKVGVVAVGCNIHDSMVAFIKVVDTPYAAKSDASGLASVRGAPGGQATLRIWHPYLKAPGNEVVRTVTLPAGGTQREAAVLDVRMPAPRHNMY